MTSLDVSKVGFTADTNYLVAKWIAHFQLKYIIDDINRRHAGRSGNFPLFDILNPDVANRVAIARFWDSDEDSISPKALIAILKLQATFRIWTQLKKLRGVKNIKFAAEENILSSQTAVRRWASTMEVSRKVKRKEVLYNNYTNFCKRMKKGYDVIIYSHAQGLAWKRKLSFTSDLENICFPTSPMLKKKIPLDSIYEVKKGQSGYFYPFARPQHKLWCIHFRYIPDKVIDIEALSVEDYRELYYGFQNMIIFHTTRSPFFIDSNGIPRRAEGSIIEYALDNPIEGIRSEADHLRLEDALIQLSQEYDRWTKQYSDEKQRWVEEQKKLKKPEDKKVFVEGNDDDDDESGYDASDVDEDEDEDYADQVLYSILVSISLMCSLPEVQMIIYTLINVSLVRL